MARSRQAKTTEVGVGMSRKRKAAARAAAKSTRDIAVRAWAAIDAHIEECKEFRRSMSRTRREDLERHTAMHQQNQEALQNLARQITEASENLKKDIVHTDNKVDEAELENAKRDLEKEKANWTWRERIYWGLGSALLGLLVFLLKQRFFP